MTPAAGATMVARAICRRKPSTASDPAEAAARAASTCEASRPIGAASTAVRAAFGGATASQITTENGFGADRRHLPRATGGCRSTKSAGSPFAPTTAASCTSEDVAKLKYEAAPAILTRKDRADVVPVSASLEPGAELSNVLRDFHHRIDNLRLNDNVQVEASAESSASLMGEALTSLGTSLLGSIVLVYLLMVALYNSFRSPFVVLLAIPPATIGALLALAVTHQTLNLYSLIGTILLVGLVTKNSILLVDCANTLRVARKLSRGDAILESAKVRFRPIIMTTIAVIVGLLPVALGLDPGAASRRALGIVVIGGLSSSLVLTLILVPLFYRWIAPKRLKDPVRFAAEAPAGAAPAT